MIRTLILLPLFFVLASCGSGGSSSSSDDSNSSGSTATTSPDATTDATTTSVVSATNSSIVSTYTHTDTDSFQNVSLTVNNVPEAGIHLGFAIDQEDTSIVSVDFVQTTDNTGDIRIQFASGTSLSEGTHLNKVALAMCYDVQCSTHIAGSPVVIDTTLEVIASTDSISLDNDLLSVQGNSAQGITPGQSIIPVTISGADPTDLHIQVSENSGNTVSVSSASHQILNGKLDLLIDFYEAQYISSGSHANLYDINICHDIACNYPLVGSPLGLSVDYEISNLPESVDIATPDVRAELNHDVIDAEYSASLNAIAIASSAPINAVYIYYLDDLSTAYEIPLDLAPTAISFANAGNSKNIAVGHDAKVTFIDFNESNPNASNKNVLDIPIDVYDLVATDEAVYAVPRVDQWTELYRVDISDYSVTTHDGYSIYAASKIKLHPDLNSVYLANNGLSPSDIEKISIETTQPSYVADSPYHGDYAMCGDLWMSNSGDRIYTACGNTFRSSDVASQDMIYTGKLPLTSADSYQSYQLKSVAESTSNNEVAVIEYENDYSCQDTTEGCIHILSFFTRDFLGRTSGSAFDSVVVAGNSYPEKPDFVFYNDEGTSAFVISQLTGIPTQKSYILEFNR